MDERFKVLVVKLVSDLINVTEIFFDQELKEEESFSFVFSLLINAHLISMFECSTWLDKDDKEHIAKIDKIMKGFQKVLLENSFAKDKEKLNIGE